MKGDEEGSDWERAFPASIALYLPSSPAFCYTRQGVSSLPPRYCVLGAAKDGERDGAVSVLLLGFKARRWWLEGLADPLTPTFGVWKEFPPMVRLVRTWAGGLLSFGLYLGSPEHL